MTLLAVLSHRTHRHTRHDDSLYIYHTVCNTIALAQYYLYDSGQYVSHNPLRSNTLTAILCPYLSREVGARLETYRLRWEDVNGPTDLTKYYSSRWPQPEQVALIRTDFRAYVSALPPFLVDWIDRDLRAALEAGPSAEIADKFIRLFNLGGSPRPPRQR